MLRRIAAGVLVLLPALAGSAGAQGVVLGTDGQPLKVSRVRALLVFQELGGFGHLEQRPNREDLLVELELAAPAPGGAVWLLAAPGKPQVRPAAAAALDEVGRFWRAGAPEPGTEAWPPAPAEAGPVPAVFGAPAGGPREFLKSRDVSPDPAIAALIDDQAAGGWGFFVADVPAGTRRLSAHLTFTSLCALYPGAAGAVPVAGDARGGWRLPPLELMVLHNHFISIDDNTTGGLSARLGLLRLYQDEGMLTDAHRWADPGKDRPGRLQASAAALGRAAELVRGCAPAGRFLLTVIGGEPAAPARKSLDFTIYSLYPTAADPLPPGRSGLILLGVLAVVVVLTAVLLRRKSLTA